MPEDPDSTERIVITSAEVLRPIAPVVRARAVPVWGLVLLIVLTPFLPLLCLAAICIRVAFRGRELRVRAAWDSLLCTLLVVSAFVALAGFAFLWTFTRSSGMATAETIQVAAGPDALDDAAALPSLPTASEMSPVDLAARSKQLVFIVTPGTNLATSAVGAGLLLLADDLGYLLATNRHVADAEGWLPLQKKRDHVTVVPSDGAAARADIVGRHRRLDLALLWIPRRHGHGSFHQPIVRFDAVPVGQPIFVFGHPERLYFTMSSGLVSRRDPSGLLQLSAPVSPGNSGGPAYDSFGRLIGVVTSKVDKLLNPNAENLNFATRADAFLDANDWDFSGPGAAALDRFRNQPH